MHEVEKLIKQIIKKTGDKQATYMWGYEFSSDTGPNFKAVIKYSKGSIPAFIAGGLTEEELIKNLQMMLDEGNIKDIAVMYCEAQIKLEEQAIKFHKDLIKQYEENLQN